MDAGVDVTGMADQDDISIAAEDVMRIAIDYSITNGPCASSQLHRIYRVVLFGVTAFKGEISSWKRRAVTSIRPPSTASTLISTALLSDYYLL